MAGFDFILCADDYGMTEAVSRGLLEVAAAGRISAASAMASLPDWRRAARDWAAARPPVDLGLHVTLTVGAPLGAMPQFAPGGEFPGVGALAAAALARRLPGEEIEAEILRQIDAFCAATGAPPSHVDGHQHVHIFPQVRTAFLAAVAHHAPGAWVRQCGRAHGRRPGSPKALLLDVLSRKFRRRAAQAGVSFNPGFAGAYDFTRQPEFGPLMESFLDDLPDGGLVMCHPGFVDDVLISLDPLAGQREREYAYLAGDEFIAMLLRNGVALR